MLTALQVYSLIQQKIYDNEPFSMVRIGDGEGMVISQNKEYSDYVFKRQLDYIPNDKYIIRDNLIQTYSQADLIGIATRKRVLEGEFWSFAKDSALEFSKNNQFCSIDIHFDFLNEGYYDELFKSVTKLFYISGRNITNVLRKKYPNLDKIEGFIITPELKFESNKEREKHYPDQYLEIKHWISELDCSNSLCLVGAGVIGKIYNIWFKKRGGVSLDIGSIFDLWAGRKTRGIGRGVDIIDNTYKL
jgi:hypothetical protein